MKAVLDTNVLFSGFIFKGKPGAILNAAKVREFVAVSSPILVEELLETLRKKTSATEEKLILFQKKLEKFIELVYPREEIDVCRDPNDNRVLEAAVEGECDYIITGDRDLLSLKKYQKILILTPAEFLQKLNSD